jgi:asparagine synthase (glutamine-hydrolysing)
VPGISRELDPEAIDDYLTFGYVPSPRSAFAAIRKVPPGHTLTLRDGRVTVERYWRPAFTPKLAISFDDAVEQVRERIDDAVKVRLISDVPIGAFLSGGLDSSTVVAHMARHSERPVKTFSIGFADRSFDELHYARVVARAFGTDHHELVVDADQTDVLPMLVRHLGEPFADSSVVPTYHVARITREHVTVALNGDGGDELFAGYDRYKAAAIARLTTERVPAPLVRGLSRVAAAVPLTARLPRAVHRARRFAVALGTTPEERHLKWTGYFTGELRERVVGEQLRSLDRERAYRKLAAAAELSGAIDPAEHYRASDILTYLPDDLLVKVDIASMACSLEARSPLLDHELAELVLRLPPEYKLSPRTSKVLLRKAMRGIVPDEILDRKRKMGFSAPIAAWLRGPLRGLVTDVMAGSRVVEHGYVAPGAAARLFEEHADGRADRTPQLWNLLMLELWLRECVDVPAASVGATAPATISA